MRSRAVDLLAAAVVVLCILSWDPSGWFTFAPLKWMWVTTGTALLLAVAAATGALRRPTRVGAIIGGALLAWLALAATFGVEGRYAWWGTPERHAGWLLAVIVMLLMVCGASVRAVAAGLAVAGAVLLLVLLLDAAGRPIGSSDTDRLTGTFGSAAYLAAACTLIAPAALGLALDAASGRGHRIVGWLGAAGGCFGLIGSGTRGAWLAALIVGLPMVWMRRRHPTTRWVVGGALAVALAAVLLTPVGQRASSAFDASGAGGASRLDEWRVGMQTLDDRWLLGAGPEGYRIVFSDGVDPDYERQHGRQPQTDRAHNAILDMALAGGLPAAALYAAALGCAALGVCRMLRRGAEPIVVGAACALAAYALQQQSLFPLAECEPIAALLLGSVVLRDAPPLFTTSAGPGRLGQRALRLSAVAAATIATVIAVMYGARDVAADRAAARAVELSGKGQPDDALDAARRAIEWRDDQVRLHLLLARLSPDIDERAAAFAAARALSPGDPIVLRQHAAFLTDTNPAEAVALLARLTADDPLNAGLRQLYGVAAARVGDEGLAEQQWLMALSLRPADPGPRANLVTLYRQQGRTAEADALEGGPAFGNR